LESAKQPDLVTAMLDALSSVLGDSAARLMLIQGTTLADLIGWMLRSPIKNAEAIKLVTQALGSNVFLIEPEIAGPSHIAYIYDPPGSLHVVDIAIDTTQGRVVSAAIRLRLRDVEGI
jgi:hypothetical protein